jgi:hypothetical protein
MERFEPLLGLPVVPSPVCLPVLMLAKLESGTWRWLLLLLLLYDILNRLVVADQLQSMDRKRPHRSMSIIWYCGVVIGIWGEKGSLLKWVLCMQQSD